VSPLLVSRKTYLQRLTIVAFRLSIDPSRERKRPVRSAAYCLMPLALMPNAGCLRSKPRQGRHMVAHGVSRGITTRPIARAPAGRHMTITWTIVPGWQGTLCRPYRAYFFRRRRTPGLTPWASMYRRSAARPRACVPARRPRRERRPSCLGRGFAFFRETPTHNPRRLRALRVAVARFVPWFLKDELKLDIRDFIAAEYLEVVLPPRKVRRSTTPKK